MGGAAHRKCPVSSALQAVRFPGTGFTSAPSSRSSPSRLGAACGIVASLNLELPEKSVWASTFLPD
ncbi:hypothetical protein PRBEI_2000466400 [Prionailurus iriomotensis]